MKNVTCCFTGHRNIPSQDIQTIWNNTEKCVRELIEQGVRCFRLGGACGYDTLAAHLMIKLRDEERIPIKIILIAPLVGFINSWNPAQKEIFKELLPKYDRVVYVADCPSKKAYLDRDRSLVDKSGYCIAYCVRKTGGTAYTVNYALKNGVKVINVAC